MIISETTQAASWGERSHLRAKESWQALHLWGFTLVSMGCWVS